MMIFSVIFGSPLQLSGAHIIWSVFAFFLIFVIAGICTSVLKYAIWRRKISQNIPSVKLKTRFSSLLGFMRELSLTKKGRNGQTILAFAHQLLLKHAKLLEQEKLYCEWLFFYPVIVLSKAEAVEVLYGGTKSIEIPFFFTDFRISFLETASVLETICGVDVRAQKSEKKTVPFVNSINRAFRLFVRRILNPLLWPDFLFYASETGREVKKCSQVAKGFIRDLMEKEKQKILEPSQDSEMKGMSLLKLLLNRYYSSEAMGEEEIIDHLMMFMIAGQDTTKIALIWILYMLGLHADIRAKVHEELDLIFGEDYERHATVEDMKNLKYLERVIKETLRLYPPLPVLARYLNEDTTTCGYQIPKGTTCVVFPLVLHRDEKVFLNPEKFDPDRFLPENSASRHPYAYIPFGAAPRNCIGQKLAFMELLIVTPTILRRYTVESLDPRDQVLPVLTFALSSSKPIRIRIRKRHTKKN
ncbi:unnamed protein product [Larinioides sclopetarius]|uniref:Cytochrome P450 n=1 Tax=Larinioides sclopetarius TaxID=280406 RepID=A0AAV1ZIN2_9ARAC